MTKGFNIKNLFSSGFSNIVEKIIGVVDTNITAKEEKEKVKAELISVLGELELDLEKIKLNDRVSARDLQVAQLNINDKKSRNFLNYFSWFWSVVSIGYFTATTFMPVENERVADTILGFLLGTAVAAIINFHYGSSSGSSSKSDMIETILNKK